VSIATGVSPNPVSLDERLTFTLVITRLSQSRAKSVALADSPPASAAFICYSQTLSRKGDGPAHIQPARLDDYHYDSSGERG
jgi:hypothetical protein